MVPLLAVFVIFFVDNVPFSWIFILMSKIGKETGLVRRFKIKFDRRLATFEELEHIFSIHFILGQRSCVV